MELSMSSKNQVLSNTMGMLAITMIPTVIGAVFGTAMQWSLMTMLMSFGGAIALMLATMYFRNSNIGVLTLLGFTGLMGMMLGPLLSHVLQGANGAAMIGLAFGGTALTFAGSWVTVLNTNKDFSVWSKGLFWALIALVVMGILNIWLQLTFLHLAIAAAGMVVFTMYLLMDLQRVVNGGETNYLVATISVYLDLINIFSSMLQILDYLDD